MPQIKDSVFQNLRTGDLILFCTQGTGIFGFFDSLIKYFSDSPYTHIGVVIKESQLGHKKLDSTKTYIWESGYEGTPDPQDGKIRLGVQITDLESMMKRYEGKLYVRKLDCPNDECRRIFNQELLSSLQAQVYGKPYDLNIVDWLGAFGRHDNRPQKVDRFWCSAFIGYIYTQAKLLKDNTDWSILRPSDFSVEDNDIHLNYNSNVVLEKKQYLLCE